MSTPATIRVDQIQKTDNALRQVDLENEAFQEILASVREVGILNPISVRTTSEEGKYELVDGRHRLTAATEADLEEIPVLIFDSMTDHEQLKLQLIANSARVDTRPAEYANQIKRLLEADPSVNVHDIAKQICKPASWVIKMLRLTKLPEAIQESVDAGDITLQNAIALSDLPEDEQPEWLDRAMNMVGEDFIPEVSARAREIKEEKRKGKAVEETFTAVAKPRKGAEILNEYAEGCPNVTAICSNPDEEEGARKALAWIVKMDEETVSEQEAIWTQKKKARDENKARREREKLEKAEVKNTEKAEAIRTKMAELEETPQG